MSDRTWANETTTPMEFTQWVVPEVLSVIALAGEDWLEKFANEGRTVDYVTALRDHLDSLLSTWSEPGTVPGSTFDRAVSAAAWLFAGEIPLPRIEDSEYMRGICEVLADTFRADLVSEDDDQDLAKQAAWTQIERAWESSTPRPRRTEAGTVPASTEANPLVASGEYERTYVSELVPGDLLATGEIVSRVRNDGRTTLTFEDGECVTYGNPLSTVLTRVVMRCGADDCGRPIWSGDRYYYHHRLGARLHPHCYHNRTVEGEDVSHHAIKVEVAP